MVKLHGEEVNVGDTVWDMHSGWGEVKKVCNDKHSYPIYVCFGCRCYKWFTEDGKLHVDEKMPSLFWQPIKFEIPKKPKKKKKKAWQWVCKSGNRYYLTHGYYTSKEEVSSLAFAAEPIEPYLPSEIEREVKE